MILTTARSARELRRGKQEVVAAGMVVVTLPSFIVGLQIRLLGSGLLERFDALGGTAA